MIRLKEGQNLVQSIILYPAHPILKAVLLDIEREYAMHNASLIITEWHRPARHECQSTLVTTTLWGAVTQDNIPAILYNTSILGL